MRVFLTFLLTPLIVCTFSVLFMHLSKSGLSFFEGKDASFIFLFLIMGPALFMSFFVYVFEIILFLPLYAYLSKKSSITTLCITASSVVMSLIAGAILSLGIKNAVNIQFIAFSGVIGLLSGLVFSFIHGKHQINKKNLPLYHAKG